MKLERLLARLQMRAAPAPEELRALRELAPTLPEDYLEVMSHHDGGFGWLTPLAWFDLLGVKDVIAITRDRWMLERSRHFIFFGGDGSRELFAFDLRTQPPAIVMTDITGEGEDDPPCARSLRELLQGIVSTGRLPFPPPE
jgi:hypothetical protein